MSVTPPLPQTQAVDLARRANLERAEVLIAVSEGLLSLTDVFYDLERENGRYLSAMSLRQLLIEHPNFSVSRANSVMTAIKRNLGTPELSSRKMTLAWLFDPRTGGRRAQAFADAVFQGRSAGPWSGFPFTACPRGANDE